MDSIIPVGIILILVAAPAALFLLARLNLRFGLIWLVSAVIAAGVWGSALWLAWHLPVEVPWSEWGEQAGLFGGPAWLLVDERSWPMGLALSTLVFAAVLTSLSGQSPPNVRDLAGILFFGGLGLAAVYSGSVSALLIAWTVTDLAELGVLLASVRERRESERVVIAFSGNLMGSMLLLLGLSLARESELALTAIPDGINTWFIFAAGFRLGVLPAQPPLRPFRVLRPDFGTLVRLAPAAGAVTLLSRAALSGDQVGGSVILLVLVVISGLYGAVNWLILEDASAARPFWRIGTASLAVAAALLSQPGAVIGWGFTLVIGGGLIFLSGLSEAGLFWLFVLGAVLLFGFPYTPTWEASLLVSESGFLWGGLAGLITALLLGGYLAKARSAGSVEGLPARGVRALYVAGDALLVASLAFAGLVPVVRGEQPAGSWWAGFAPAALTAAGAFLLARSPFWPFPAGKELRPLLDLAVFYRMLWRLYRLTGRGVVFLTRVLEGRSAILWAILLLALLISLIAQTGLGS